MVALGQVSIKERQYERARELTIGILRSFEVIEAVLRDQPWRQFFIFPPPCLRFVGASDAALEQPRQGLCFCCIVWLDDPGETREAGKPLWLTSLR